MLDPEHNCATFNKVFINFINCSTVTIKSLQQSSDVFFTLTSCIIVIDYRTLTTLNSFSRCSVLNPVTMDCAPPRKRSLRMRGVRIAPSFESSSKAHRTYTMGSCLGRVSMHRYNARSQQQPAK